MPLPAELVALIDAVKESPEDDAPRLVLADWLDEHGDAEGRARAELIRTQCELMRGLAEAVCPEEPGPVHSLFQRARDHLGTLPHKFSVLVRDTPRLAALKAREEELIKEHGPRWLAAMSVKHVAEWHRGLCSLHANYAPFQARAMARFAEDAAGHWVERLTVEAVPSNAATVARSPLLARPVSLEVRGLRLKSPDVVTVLSSPHLGSVRRLDLSTRLEDGANVAALARRPPLVPLTHLYLYSNSLGAADVRQLAGLELLRSLRGLHLGGNYGMGAKSAKELARAPFLAGLEELTLTNCRIGASGVEALLSSPHFSAPSALALGSNGIDAAGVRALLNAPGLERVAFLDLSNNYLDDGAVAELAASPRWGSLVSLDLSGNRRLGPAAAEALAGSRHLPRLVSIDLLACPLGEAGVWAMARSRRLPRVRKVVLDHEDAEAPAVKALRERFGSLPHRFRD